MKQIYKDIGESKKREEIEEVKIKYFTYVSRINILGGKKMQ